MFWLTLAAAAWRFAAAQQPAANTLWAVDISLPAGAVASVASREGYLGGGVDLRFSNTSVQAYVYNPDGTAFFQVAVGNASCKIDVGSDGQSPGLRVLVFEQNSLRCTISGSGGPPAPYQLSVAAEFDPSAACQDPGSAEPCDPAWRPAACLRSSAPPSWYLWKAAISVPAGSVVRKTSRTSDPGYGVDISILRDGARTTVEAGIWDDDGAGFFEVAIGNASCKVDVSSNGLGPGLQVMIFEQRDLDCVISGAGGPKDYNVTVGAVVAADGSANCPEKSETEDPCHPAWHPDAPVLWSARVALPEGSAVRKIARRGDAGYGIDSEVWTSRLQLPEGSVARKIDFDGCHGHGVDLRVRGTVVAARAGDDSGHAFVEVKMGSASCKLKVSSNGQGLGFEVYEQKGLPCAVSGTAVPGVYRLAAEPSTPTVII